MRYALIYYLSGLVILLSPFVGAVPASSPSLDLNNNDWLLDDLSDPISLLHEDDELDLEDHDDDEEDDESNTTSSDSELPSPSPQFDKAHLPVIYHPQNIDPPNKSSLAPRALVSVVANANSSSFVDAQSLAVIAAGAGRSTGKSRTSADPVGYRYIGCYTDPGGVDGQRTLTGKRTVIPNMTKELFQATCSVWPYYGLEYGNECSCGNAILNGGHQVDDGNCSKPCEGNDSQMCGGNDRLSIYYDPAVPGPNDPPTFNGANLLGCYVENYPYRVLDSGGTNSDAAMTLDLCSNYCYGLTEPALMNYWGLERGGDCWCGVTINSSASLAPNLNYCGMGCPGNELQLCGGDNLVIVYQKIV